MSVRRPLFPSRVRAAALAAAVALAAAAASGAGAPAAPPESAQPGVRMSLRAHEYSLGSSDAPLTIVEFTDYQCPYCRQFQAQTWPLLKRDYVDTGKVRFIVRDLPLSIHSAARSAAEVAHCAGAQGRFWPMHEALLASDAQLTDDYVLRQARAMGLNAQRLSACATADRYEAAITRNANAAAALGIQGTPTFIIGRSQPRELRGERLGGAQPYEAFDAVLKRLLAQD